MKRNIENIAVIYPPFRKGEDYPLLSQNRHLKFSASMEVRIFPVTLGQMATHIQERGYRVAWMDGINERKNMAEFNSELIEFSPDMIVMETKAPVIEMHWKYAEYLKKTFPDSLTVLIGDHISHQPDESFKESQVIDYTVPGGYYDFVVPELIDHLNGKGEMPGSVHWRGGNSGKQKVYDQKDISIIDRDLTKSDIYHEAYLHHPAAYIMSGRGCGAPGNKPGVCTFCVWQYTLWKLNPQLRPVKNVVDEIEMLYRRGVREIFDDNDSSFLYDREWTKAFCEEMHRRKLAGKIYISGNARSDTLDYDFCKMLKKAGFRLLKIGIEAGSDETLKRIGKGESMKVLMDGIKAAKKAGIKIFLTNMVGYPWQSEEEVRTQYNWVKKLMFYRTRFGDSMQASVVVPYPGTPLYRQAEKNNWFAVNMDDYRNLDMDEPVMQTQIDTTFWVRKFWRIQMHPWFLFKSLITIRNQHDVKLAWTGVKSLLGHIRDYTQKGRYITDEQSEKVHQRERIEREKVKV